MVRWSRVCFYSVGGSTETEWFGRERHGLTRVNTVRADNKIKVVHVVGARPNFVKIANIVRACNAADRIESVLVHTGQHYSANMSASFFDELDIPHPDINLEVGSGSHAQQTGEIIKRFESVLLEHEPTLVLVVGDVNSTAAAALVAVKLGIKVAHVEAGLRSFDRTMPEEINRLVTDAISDFLFITEPSAQVNLEHEGVDASKIHYVGNVMIDTLERHREKALRSSILDDLGLNNGPYGVLTLHRPSNVDHHETFSGILDALETIQRDMTIVLPAHPRTVKNIEGIGLMDRIRQMGKLRLVDPLGYLDFLKLMAEARLVLTDSGGIQEETTILGVPCLTIRENTERPITITEGTNQLVGCEPSRILEGYRRALAEPAQQRRPKFWDGQAAQRIVDVLLEVF